MDESVCVCVCVRAVPLLVGNNVFKQPACQRLVLGFSPPLFRTEFPAFALWMLWLIVVRTLDSGRTCMAQYRMGKGRATAISNIQRHLMESTFCTGYLALGLG